ncbi:MAG: hypothetical protein AAB366_02180 [Patescibacteria group bacterium]
MRKKSDFERKGNHWLELVRNWIIEANQAKNFALEDNFSEMKNFLKKIGSNRRIFDQRLFVDFKKPWNYLYFLPAEARAPSEARGEGERNRLMWCYFSICSNFFREETLTAPRLIFLGEWWRGAEFGLARAEEGFGEESARASAFFFEKIGG